MQAYPFLIAGTGRFDTDLMIDDSGTIVSKGGAQGVEGIGLLTSGLGFGLKIADGTSSSIGPVSVHVLDLLGAFNGEQRDWIADHTEVVIRNHAGAIVGVMRTTFGIGGAAE
jgi:L-asparaginase II